eukprot:1333977-Pyramimonas_sp.AAC.1
MAGNSCGDARVTIGSSCPTLKGAHCHQYGLTGMQSMSCWSGLSSRTSETYNALLCGLATRRANASGGMGISRRVSKV